MKNALRIGFLIFALIIATRGPFLWAAEPIPPDVEARAIRTGIPSPPVCPVGPSKCTHLNVRLRLLIGQDGKVLDIVIIDGSAIDSVNNTAIDYVTNWPFSPALKAGKPVESWVTVRVTFA